MSTASSQPDPSIERLVRSARKLHQQGELDRAALLYMRVLERQPENADALYLLGLVKYRQASLEEAITLVEQATRHDSNHALAHASLAQIYQDTGDHKRAVLNFRRAAELDPRSAAIHNGLGLSLYYLGRPGAARDYYERAVELDPKLAAAHNNLGNLFRALGDLSKAQACYSRCLSCRADFVEAHSNLGVLYQQQQDPERAIACFEAALELRPDYAEAWNNRGAALNDQGREEAALVSYQRAVSINPSFTSALVNLGVCLHKLGEHERARRVLDRVLELEPENPAATWARCVAELQPVYASEAEMKRARQRYTRGLEQLETLFDGGAGKIMQAGSSLVGLVQPFLLPYQGQNDRGLQSRYGDLLCRCLPEPAARASTAQRAPGNIRVALVSAFFYDHSNWKIPIQGWLSPLSQRFELSLYHTGQKQDVITRRLREQVPRFYSGLSAEQYAEHIREQQIDVLIYPEVGMHPVTTWLAAQRLAPVQCVSWGHPVSSGLPTMDYFISSDWMEPGNARDQYRERLIRLPGLSFNWARPKYAASRLVERDDFGLAKRDKVFLCVQNLSKYLPRYDYLLAEISRRVPDARLVFIRGTKASTDQLINRLRRCFADYVVDFDQHVVFLDRLDREKYHALNRIADVSLDTPDWSGCNSTLEALWCDLPVVTLPRGLMRGRHSEAIYRQMDYHALVAGNEAQYIELAVRLGTDREWRLQQRDEISASRHRLCDDDTPARALVDQIEKIVAGE